jgi:membrane-bound lytic murein transglycosylase D
MPTGAIHLTRPYAISELAINLSVSEKELLRWNPEILRGITPPIRTAGGTYPLRIKEELIPILNEKLPKIAFLDISDTFEYRIKPGDTLRSIAKKHGVSLSEILKINPGLKPTALRIGRGLLVPAG